MSIADIDPRPAGRIYTCKIAELIKADEKPADADVVVHARFTDTSYSNRALAEWLSVSEGTVVKHRRGHCACVRSQS